MKNNDDWEIYFEQIDENIHKPVGKVQSLSPHPSMWIDENHYNPLTIPPDWSLAENHAVISLLGKYYKLSRRPAKPNLLSETCLCCGFKVDRKLVGLGCSVESLSFLGSGYPLYFTFIKSVIVVLSLQMIAVGQYSIISNFLSNECIPGWKHSCSDNFVLKFSQLNRPKSGQYNQIEDFLSLTATFIMLGYFWLFRRNQKKLDITCDVEENTPGDYTLIVSNIPILENQTQVKKYLTQTFQQEVNVGKHHINVENVNLIYDLNEYYELLKIKKNLIDQRKKSIDQLTLTEIKNIEIKIAYIQMTLQKQFQQKFTGIALVSFKKESQKRRIFQATESSMFASFLSNYLNMFTSTTKWIKHKDRKLFIEEAPEPNDIDWQALGTYLVQSPFLIFLDYLFQTSLYLLLTLIVLYLAKVQAIEFISIQDSSVVDFEINMMDNKVTSFILRILGASTLVSINLLLHKSGDLTSKLRYYISITRKLTKVSKRLTLLMSLNILIGVHFLIVTLVDSTSLYAILIQTVFYFLLCNAIIPNIVCWINPYYFMNKFKIKKEKSKGDECLLTQEQANSLCEYPAHNIYQSYSYIVSTMFITYFYGLLLPFGFVITSIGLTIFYWMEKLLAKFTPFPNGKVLPFVRIITSNDTVIIVSSCHIWFPTPSMPYIPILCAIELIVAVIYNLLPNEYLIDLIWQLNDQDEDLHYDEKNFQTTYEMLNPATKRLAVNQLNQEIRKKSQPIVKNPISDDHYLIKTLKKAVVEDKVESFLNYNLHKQKLEMNANIIMEVENEQVDSDISD